MITTSCIFISCSLACHKLICSCIRSGFFYSDYFSTTQKNGKNCLGKEKNQYKTCIYTCAGAAHSNLSEKPSVAKTVKKDA